MNGHEELLRKYIEHVKQCEGIDFIDRIDDGWGESDVQFTAEEVNELNRLAQN